MLVLVLSWAVVLLGGEKIQADEGTMQGGGEGGSIATLLLNAARLKAHQQIIFVLAAAFCPPSLCRARRTVRYTVLWLNYCCTVSIPYTVIIPTSTTYYCSYTTTLLYCTVPTVYTYLYGRKSSPRKRYYTCWTAAIVTVLQYLGLQYYATRCLLHRPGGGKGHYTLAGV